MKEKGRFYRYSHLAIGVGVTAAACLYFGLTQLHGYYHNRIFPGISIENIDVGGLRQAEAIELVSQKLPPPTPQQEVVFTGPDTQVISTVEALGIEYAIVPAVKQAFEAGKHNDPIKQLLQVPLTSLDAPNFKTTLTYNRQAVEESLAALEDQLTIEGRPARAQLASSGVISSLTVDPGVVGRIVDSAATLEQFERNLEDQVLETQVVIASTSATIAEEELESARQRAAAYVGQQLELTHEERTLAYLEDTELISLLAFPQGYFKDELDTLVATISARVERPAQNAVFSYDKNTLDVSEFQPPLEGRQLQVTEFARQLVAELESFEETNLQPSSELSQSSDAPDSTEAWQLELPLEIHQPETTLESTNDLGITEEIGFGESYYHHSIPSRVHNVGLTSERINNFIIPPGEEFSFNQALGEVSRATGFQPAYVILGGQTVLGDGGGVCQVSSTLFRTVLDSGLNITRRLPHSYRVSYYELNSDPGFDATVYSGDIDFRFKNDTQHHVLIHSVDDPENLHLTISLYGTSDGRTTEITDYRTWNYRSALAPQYIPSADLAPGQRRQIDWGVSGINAEFVHKVYDKDGNLLDQDTYTSTYRPWASKFLVGE